MKEAKLVNYTQKIRSRRSHFLFSGDVDKLGIGRNCEEGHDYQCHKFDLSYLFPYGKAVVRNYQQLYIFQCIRRYALVKLARD